MKYSILLAIAAMIFFGSSLFKTEEKVVAADRSVLFSNPRR